MRLTSQIWVEALLRTAFGSGAYGCVVKRGSAEAGAIFIIINHLDGQFSLFGQAPQILLAEGDHSDRLFVELIGRKNEQEVLNKLESEKKFDYDLWIVEIENRNDKIFFEIAIE